MRTPSLRNASNDSRTVDRALRHRVVTHEPDFRSRLPLQHAHEVRVAHRRERMVFHARLVEQRIADKQMAAKDRAAVLGKRRAGNRESRRVTADGQRVEQRVRHRADVARVGRIERRAVFEEELAAALRAQPVERGERLRDRVGGGNRARLQRDHQRVGLDRCRSTRARRSSAPCACRRAPACWRDRSRR